MFESLRRAVRDAAQLGVITADAVRTTGLLGAMSATALARFGARHLFSSRNPSGIITLHALNTPDKEALVQGDRRWTYRELDTRVDRLANALNAAGVDPGGRVALMMRNSHAFLEVQWATARALGYVVQIGYRLKPAEVAYILGNSEPRVLVVGASEEDVAREGAAQAGWRGRIVAAADHESFLAGGAPTPPTVSKNAEEKGGVMVYTSGTTGRPKGAARSYQKQFHVSVADFLRQLHVHHDDRHLVVAPLYHSAAPAFVVFNLIVGATIVLAEHGDADEALALIGRERITSAFMVPTMLSRLAAAQHGPPPPTLRWLASGAAPLPTETARRVEAAFGRILYNFYGATETGLVTLALPGEHTARPGTIGRALAGNEIRLLDENGHDVPPAAIGELYVKNSMLVAGYHKDGAATASAMKDGFFSVGDMARVDKGGYYYLADRKSDMVISGGVNIYPQEIEQRLHAHPAVQEAAVIGVPDDEWGEALRAFVVLRPGQDASAADLAAFCKETLANFKVPKRFEFIDALPRNPTGKVLKRELRNS